MSDEGIVFPTLPQAPAAYDERNEAEFRGALQRYFTDASEALLRVIADTATDIAALSFPSSGLTLMPASGRWFRATATAETLVSDQVVVTEDRLYLVPFVPSENATLTDLAFNVDTGAGSSTCRIGLYSDSGQLTPDAVLAESGDLDTSTTGAKTLSSLSVSLTGGTVYWFAVAAQAGTPTLRAAPADNSISLGRDSASNMFSSGDTHAYITLGASWTALPDPAGSITGWANTNAPLMAGKV
jgi:hypothetical protein